MAKLENKTEKLNMYPSNAIVENTFPSSSVLGSAHIKTIALMITPELK